MGENLKGQSMLLSFMYSERIPHWASIGKAIRVQLIDLSPSEIGQNATM
jgi:hypothetical protein